jgi:hypothetical protein
MEKIEKILLSVDIILNTVLGLFLLCFPLDIGEVLGLPKSDNYFYTLILGAVLLGIGITLFIELKYHNNGIRGLGLEGAITINFIASIVLIIILLTGALNISLVGSVILWFIGTLVFFIGVAEYFRNRLFKK